MSWENFFKNIETNYINYTSIKEDSLNVVINGNMANARFTADINVTLNGNIGVYHLDEHKHPFHYNGKRLEKIMPTRKSNLKR